MKRAYAAGGGQDAGITQPRDHFFSRSLYIDARPSISFSTISAKMGVSVGTERRMCLGTLAFSPHAVSPSLPQPPIYHFSSLSLHSPSSIYGVRAFFWSCKQLRGHSNSSKLKSADRVERRIIFRTIHTRRAVIGYVVDPLC